MKSKDPNALRVAVIGTGLAGLTAAHLLQEQSKASNGQPVEVHLFERSEKIGMDSASIDVVGADGKIHRVDSPMRAMQGGYYAHLLRLYERLGIQLDKSNFTYAFLQLAATSGRTRSSPSSFSTPEDKRRRDYFTSANGRSRQENDNASLKKRKNTHCRYSPQDTCERERLQASSSSGTSETAGSSTKTTFIYNGGNGLSLRPFSFPRNGLHSGPSSSSSFSPSSSASSSKDSLWQDLLRFPLSTILLVTYRILEIVWLCFKVALFASSYIYLALLSFYHVYLTSHTSLDSDHWVSKSTFSTFLLRARIPRLFAEEILIPLFACVATCSPNEILDYPAAEFLEYIARTFGTDHYVVRGGVQSAVDELLSNIPQENLHLGCELVSLRRTSGSEESEQQVNELKDAQGNIWTFNHVIFATQANQARILLADHYKHQVIEQPAVTDPRNTNSTQRSLELQHARLQALSKFQYTQSIVVNHYDAANTLVQDKRDRRMLNIARWSAYDRRHVDQEDTKRDAQLQLGREYVMATHDLSVLHPSLVSPPTASNAAQPLLQTTNPTVRLDSASIVSSQSFERARVTLESRETLKLFLRYPRSQRGTGRKGDKEVDGGAACYQGEGGIWFVGSWAAEGIPLLEGCVVSAERAVEAICNN